VEQCNCRISKFTELVESCPRKIAVKFRGGAWRLTDPERCD